MQNTRMQTYTTRVRAALLAGFLCSLAGPVAETRAQDASEFQLWNAVLSTASLSRESPALSLWLDTHVRRGNGGTVHIARPGVGLTVGKYLSFWGGYAWVPVFTDDSTDARHEHRLWQQLIATVSPVPNLSLQSRTRFEQRFMEDGDDVGFRLRQFVRVAWQFTRACARRRRGGLE